MAQEATVRWRVGPIWGLLIGWVGCTDEAARGVGAVDGAVVDVGAVDVGPADAGPADAGPADAGPIDAGPADAGPADAGATPPPPPCAHIRDFNALSAPAGGALTLFDLTTDVDTVQGTCGGPGPEATYRFVAPTAGTWRFLVTPEPGHDPLLHARRTCADPGTEAACHVDLPGDTRARIHLDLAAGEGVFLFVDSENRRGGFFTLEAVPVPSRALEEPCDPEGLQDTCPAGASCLDQRCAPDGPPAITRARVVRHPDGVLGLDIEGTDVGGDVQVAWLQFFSAGALIPLDRAGATTLQVPPRDSVAGISELTFQARVRPPAAADGADRVRVRLRDSQGQTSPALWLAFEAAEALAPLQVCDPQALFVGCPEAAPCAPAPKGHRCTWRHPTAPVITAATGFAGPEGLGLDVRVADPEGDATTARATLPDGTVLEGALSPRHRLGGHSAHLSWRVPAPAGPVQVVAVDAGGLESASVEVALAPAPERGLGEPCDPARGFDFCSGDLTCAGPVPQCQPLDPACGEPARDLEGGDGAWHAFGDTTLADNFAPGSCGRGTAQNIHRFVPPADGPYYLALWSGADGADPTLSVRTHCALPGTTHPELELGCNDDSWGLEPRLRLDLTAGEPVFVVVDGFGWQGPYVLQVNQVQR